MNGQQSTILAIWSFKCKIFPDGRLLKHRARLCDHGGMHKWVINYWETYAPLVKCISVQTLLAINKIHKLRSRSIDFVLEFPQTDLDVNVYMELPISIDAHNGGKRDYILKLKKSLYGLKQDTTNWFETLKEGLNSRAFKQSQVNPCVF